MLVAQGPPKRCNGCGETKPRSEFYARRTEWGIYAQSRCKVCLRTKYDHTAYQKARRDRISQDPEEHAIAKDRGRERMRRVRGTPPERYRVGRIGEKVAATSHLVPAGPFVAWIRMVLQRDDTTIIGLAERFGIQDRRLREILNGQSMVELSTVERALVEDGTTMLWELYD